MIFGWVMIRYAKVLKCKEKDNPSPFCRVSYIISNIGDMVKCYGRMLRFPGDRDLYFAEMRLAIGDILMQCELAGEDFGFGEKASESTLNAQWGIPHYIESSVEIVIEHIVEHSAPLLRLSKYYNKKYSYRFEMGDFKSYILETAAWTPQNFPSNSLFPNFKYYILETAAWTGSLCKCFGVDVDDIRHLGFIHTIERYSQFEDEGWK